MRYKQGVMVCENALAAGITKCSSNKTTRERRLPNYNDKVGLPDVRNTQDFPPIIGSQPNVGSRPHRHRKAADNQTWDASPTEPRELVDGYHMHALKPPTLPFLLFSAIWTLDKKLIDILP